MNDIFRIHAEDSVAVALHDLAPGDTAEGNGFSAAVREKVPNGHKLALRRIEKGESVLKYGWPIGRAKETIEPGCWVHSHNMESQLEGLEHCRYEPQWNDLEQKPPVCFDGYRRTDGKTGVRNELWILPMVGCVNGLAKQLERLASSRLPAGIDGVFAFQHSCGCSQLGDDLRHTQKLLKGLLLHPNAGGVLALCLGCENNRPEDMQALLGEYDRDRIQFLVCQECEDEIEEGLRILDRLGQYAASFHREPCPVSSLTVGLKCGGSDGLSGITANPLIGSFSDWLLSRGGSCVLTEVPEMFGAERLLMNRCRSKPVFDAALGLINGFREYFMRYGQPIDENPSPGNREGGITTLAEKSLGCVQKSGTAPVEDVLLYGEQVKTNGLSLLQGPGNDLTAACALAASGAQMILFTTGRGTPLGCPVPTLKISSNTPLAEKKRNWIDFDAGQLLTGSSQEKLTEELASLVLSVASGKTRAKAEALDKSEITFFRDGVTL